MTSASVKSYQLVKVVSGGRAPGKSLSLASPQLLVIEQFHCFGAVRLDFLNLIIFDHSFKGANSGCCLLAACLLLAAAHLLLTCCLPAASLLLATPCCCLLLLAPAYLLLLTCCSPAGFDLVTRRRTSIYVYNMFKSNRISCREFICINLYPSKSSLCFGYFELNLQL